MFCIVSFRHNTLVAQIIGIHRLVQRECGNVGICESVAVVGCRLRKFVIGEGSPIVGHVVVGVVIPGGVKRSFALLNCRQMVISLGEALVGFCQLGLDGQQELHDWVHWGCDDKRNVSFRSGQITIVGFVCDHPVFRDIDDLCKVEWWLRRYKGGE